MAENKITRPQIIAGAVTAVAVLLILLLLFAGSMRFERDALAKSSMPEEIDPEELFLEPELMDLGETAPTEETDIAAPSPLGEPEQAPEVSNEKIDPGPAPEAKPDAQTLVKQTTPSAVKIPDTKQTDKPESKISQTVASKFGGSNGKPDGKNGSSGAGSTGNGVSGSVTGRTFKGCPLPTGLKLKETVKVVISVTVDASGRVTSATYKSGNAASAAIRRACEASARQARWSEKPGAADQKGTLTFTIVPKI